MGRHRWGWGLQEHALSLDAVRPRVEPFFGEVAERPQAAPRIPVPRVQVPEALSSFASASDDVRAAHAMGKSYVDRVRGFRGDFSSAPDLVVTPKTEGQLASCLEVAEREALSVMVFGAGSSVVGGVEPVVGAGHRGVLSLDLGGLQAVREVDEVSRVARIEAGALGPSLEAQLATHGLTLRHFPQSFEFSTLGGWIATRAGGHFATGPTHIDDLVQAVKMITPRGVFETRSFPASGAGVDPNRLVLGSEGRLGVITEAWVRVRPRPTFRHGASVQFDDFTAAVNAVRELSQSGLQPANCRLLDPIEAMVNGVSTDSSSVLVLGFESATHSMAPWLDEALRITSRHQGRARPRSDERSDESTAWRQSFLQGPYLQDAMIRLGLIADTFETACLWSRFSELYRGVVDVMTDALNRICGGGVVSCRFTHVYPDGPAPYFTFIGRGREGAELEQWAQIKQLASETVTALSGTITHHHAVGRTHRPWYEREVPKPFREALEAASLQLDPARVLNPGVLLAR